MVTILSHLTARVVALQQTFIYMLNLSVILQLSILIVFVVTKCRNIICIHLPYKNVDIENKNFTYKCQNQDIL